MRQVLGLAVHILAILFVVFTVAVGVDWVSDEVSLEPPSTLASDLRIGAVRRLEARGGEYRVHADNRRVYDIASTGMTGPLMRAVVEQQIPVTSSESLGLEEKVRWAVLGATTLALWVAGASWLAARRAPARRVRAELADGQTLVGVLAGEDAAHFVIRTDHAQVWIARGAVARMDAEDGPP